MTWSDHLEQALGYEVEWYRFGLRIKNERLAKGWNQKDLAEAVEEATGKKIQQKDVSRWEHNTVPRSAETRQALCEALGITVRYLMTGEPPKHPPLSLDELGY